MITTENTTTENNQIIAEFTGVEKSSYYSGIDTKGFSLGWAYVIKEKFYTYEELLYHSDWNWLMQVVEKIESLGFNFQITSQYAAVLKNHSLICQSLISTVDGINKIQATHETVAAFIKWYKI